MQITDYYNLQGQSLTFSRQQASSFAKKIANDYNPIHDVDHSRFCVPGDLLFSVIIHHYGLRQKMDFTFSGMVGDAATLRLPECDSTELDLCDDSGKKYLSIKCEGDVSTDQALIESLTKSYVGFSGRAFPHILVPLMKDNNVMINPERPLVIYESMCLSLDTLEVDHVFLELVNSELNVKGKRGDISLNYELKCNDETVGNGQKKMLLSGLRPYDDAQMAQVVEFYDQRRQKYA